ncbi:amino acid adenylation domain-containing protein [Dactylosporangium sp. NPDC051485]|uniref:amino acid adenylation domain-containing protein n=1 Tax=Dactylosporangium sp. NPDC051485 TaxID=3154846 RepID=UPI003427E6B3
MSGYLLHHYVEAATRRHPASVAVLAGGASWTYEQLNARANQIAHGLRDRGVRRGDRVGVLAAKSPETIAALHGVLKSGAAYVALDANAPAERLRRIAADAGLAAVLTDSLGATGLGVPEMSVDRGLSGFPTDDPGIALIDSDLAYVLYTSGSTGAPKGVMLTHRNATAFVQWAAGEFGLTARDRLSSHAPLHFDLSILDIFGSACAAASVVVIPAKAAAFPVRLADLIDRHGITVWYSVPSVLAGIATRAALRPGALPTLRTVLFAGEVFPVGQLRTLMALLPHARFANLYGPTETNVCTWHEVAEPPADGCRRIPIGRAIDNTEVWAVGADGRRAGPGETGELYVRGATVMRGYWNDPGLTAERLVRQGTGLMPDEVAYRTGDLVEVAADGGFTFVGRRDNQIKRRGYRIELGDIEAALAAVPSVAESAVVAVPDATGGVEIEAYAVLDAGGEPAGLLPALREMLPAYMLPDRLRTVDHLPRTSTGKVDRQALAPRGTGSAR